MLMAGFPAACRNSSFSHSFGHHQSDLHGGGIFLQLTSDLLRSVDVLEVYAVILLFGYDFVLFFGAKMSLGFDCSRHGGTDSVLSGNVRTKGQVFDAPRVLVINIVKMRLLTVINVLGSKARWTRDAYFADLSIYEVEYGKPVSLADSRAEESEAFLHPVALTDLVPSL